MTAEGDSRYHWHGFGRYHWHNIIGTEPALLVAEDAGGGVGDPAEEVGGDVVGEHRPEDEHAAEAEGEAVELSAQIVFFDFASLDFIGASEVAGDEDLVHDFFGEFRVCLDREDEFVGAEAHVEDGC